MNSYSKFMKSNNNFKVNSGGASKYKERKYILNLINIINKGMNNSNG